MYRYLEDGGVVGLAAFGARKGSEARDSAGTVATYPTFER